MNFKVNSGIWGTMFGVPCIIADNFLKLATGDQLKVLLYILRCSGGSCTDEEIALNTGVTPQQAADAVMFWQQVNVLTPDSAAITQESQIMTAISAQSVQSPVAQSNSVVKKDAVSRRKQLSSSEIAKLMEDSDDIAELLKNSERFFGTLTHAQMNSLIWMFTYLGLKKEVIITLLSYCVSIEKTNLNYIEKIAVDWSENEINNLNSAQDEVSRMLKSREFTSQIMHAFEMNRRPTAKQSELIDRWKNAGFTIELIHYAYEKTIEQIDKLSFEYINKILISWQNSGYVTVNDVKNAERDYKKKKKSSSSDSDDFDVDKYKIFINNF